MFNAPARRKPLEFLYETYLAKTIRGVVKMGVPRRQPYRRSGLATLHSVGAVP